MAQEAKDYLHRAQAIFELKNMPKLLREVKQKIKLLNQQMRNGGGPLALSAAEIAEESAYDSHGEGVSGIVVG